MPNRSAPGPGRKTDWVLSHTSFLKLIRWLDRDGDSPGQRYVEIRRRLVLYFDRKQCTNSDDLADETLNRVARRLEEEGTITTDAPEHYCYIVARFIFLESLRNRYRPELLDSETVASAASTDEQDSANRRVNCLERCMQQLNSGERGLILNYYQGEKQQKIQNRKNLASTLGLSMNALSIRACRIRDRLESCIRKCLMGEP